MASWNDVRSQAPELAETVERLFNAGRHKTMATVRADGGPRISGIECEFGEVDLTFGSMPGARKLADLQRDPRCALHSPPVDPVEGKEAEWPGEAKISGSVRYRAGTLGDDGGPQGESFRVDVESVVPHAPRREGHQAGRRVVDRPRAGCVASGTRDECTSHAQRLQHLVGRSAQRLGPMSGVGYWRYVDSMIMTRYRYRS